MIPFFQLDELWIYQFSVIFVRILQLLVIESWSPWKNFQLIYFVFEGVRESLFFLFFDEVVNKGK